MSTTNNPRKKIDPDQIRDIYFSHDIPLKNILSGKYRTILILSSTIFFAAIILAAIIKIPQEVNLPFELKGGGTEVIYQFDESVKITHSYVKMNTPVRIGDSLLRIESTELYELLSKLKTAKGEKTTYEQFTRPKITKSEEIKIKEIQNTKRSKDILIEQKNDFTTKREELLSEQHKAIQLAQKNYDRSKKLIESKTISQQQFEEANQELVRAKTAYNTNKLEFDLRIKDIEILILEYEQKVFQLENELELLSLSSLEKGQLSNSMLNKVYDEISIKYGSPYILEDAIILKADRNGTVTYINSNEQSLARNEIVMRLESQEASKTAYAVLRDRDLATIKSGLPVTLKFNNFPYFEFGTLNGVTQNISKVGSDGEFLVEIEILPNASNPLKERVLEGMRGTATILTNEKNVLGYLFDIVRRPFFQEA